MKKKIKKKIKVSLLISFFFLMWRRKFKLVPLKKGKE
jgi:hypothetical protein